MLCQSGSDTRTLATTLHEARQLISTCEDEHVSEMRNSATDDSECSELLDPTRANCWNLLHINIIIFYACLAPLSLKANGAKKDLGQNASFCKM